MTGTGGWEITVPPFNPVIDGLVYMDGEAKAQIKEESRARIRHLASSHDRGCWFFVLCFLLKLLSLDLGPG